MSLIEKPPTLTDVESVTKTIKKTPKKPVKKAVTKKLKLKPDANSIQLLNIGIPKPVTRKNCHRKYEIGIQYMLAGGKPMKKTILFGDVRQSDYIDNGDARTRSLVISHLRNYDNPLEPNFYRLKLLNSHNTLNDSYHALIKDVIKV